MLHTWAKLVMVIGIAVAVAWGARLTWVMAAAAKALLRLPRMEAGPALSELARRAHVQRLTLLDVDTPQAFCAGAWRPSVFVSRGLVQRLREPELLAVLWHEGCHARRHDPLRRAAYRTAAALLRPATVVQWWVEHRLDRAELLADQLAMRHVGAPAVAGALWRAGSASVPQAASGFGEAGSLRVAQLLGDPLPHQRPPLAMWINSMASVGLIAGILACLAGGLAALL
jgi:Zn-dependent protease with chaperone function